MSENAFIVIQGQCGELIKVDISKYNRRVQRGLKMDYGIRPNPKRDTDMLNHRCRDCGQKCKAPNGSGTQAALEMESLGEIHRDIITTLKVLKEASADSIFAYITDVLKNGTTSNTVHSRISDLKAWKIVISKDIDGPTKPTGLKYESSAVVAYCLDDSRVAILERDNWQTFGLRAIDQGLSFQLESFSYA